MRRINKITKFEKILMKIDPSGFLFGIVVLLGCTFLGVFLIYAHEYFIGYTFIILGIIVFLLSTLPNLIPKLKKHNKKMKLSKSKIDTVDSLSPSEFEEFIAGIYCKLGYKTDTTPMSCDYGIDVICERKGEKLGIQVKKYSEAVGIKAVQEVIGGLKYYNCNKGIVATSATSFTNEAIKLAEVNNIELLNREKIAKLLIKCNKGN